MSHENKACVTWIRPYTNVEAIQEVFVALALGIGPDVTIGLLGWQLKKADNWGITRTNKSLQ